MKKEKRKPSLFVPHNGMRGMDGAIFSKFQLPPEKKLVGKVVVITGGDNYIGRSVAVKFAAHGAKIVMLYWKEKKGVYQTAKYIEQLTGIGCLTIECAIMDEELCVQAIEAIIQVYSRIDVLVNNAGTPFICESIEDITNAEMEEIFRENVFPMFYLSKAVLPYMKSGSTIINATSVIAYSEIEIDYSATQGAITSFTRSLSASLVNKGIRVNGIAPGTCTPFIPSSREMEDVEEFGIDRVSTYFGSPHEIIPYYLYLASDDSSDITGQFLYPNGRITLAKN